MWALTPSSSTLDVHALTARVTYIFEHQKLDGSQPLGLSPNSSDNLQSFKVSGSYVYEYPCALLFFQDVGSRRVADRGMGNTSDGRRWYSLPALAREPTGQIGPPAAVMLLRASQPGVGVRRR